MLTESIRLIFGKSRSLQLNEAIKKAKRFDTFTEANNCYSIHTTNQEIITKWNIFHELFIITAKWSSFRLFIDENQIEKQKVWKFYYSMQELKDCFKNFQVYADSDFLCKKSLWSCIKINKIKLKPEEYGVQWFSFGHFNENCTTWIVHKKEIELIVLKEIADKKLESCPVFSLEAVIKALRTLPNTIDITDEKMWGIKYEKRFLGSNLVDYPAGIYLKIEHDSSSFNGISISLPAELFFDEEELDEMKNLKQEENIDPSINPFDEGTNDWSNWEIENYNRKKHSE